jgi:spermidine/putrescine transport system substrate-binding protein
MMKRIFSALLALLLVFVMPLGLFSCTSEKSGGNVLYVYNWGEYISDGSEDSYDTNAEFEKWYYEQTGKKITVVYSTYSSNEDMYAKLTAGAVSYDVIIPSDYMIERLINEKWLLPLNYDNIPDAANVDPDFMGKDAEYDYYDEGSVYSVPYFYGMVGIIYNTTMVDEEDVGSWELMWNEKYKGNILQFNNSRDAFGTAQYKLGIDVNTTDEAEWRRALDELKKQKGIVQGYVMDEIFNKMEGGSAAISAYYAGDFMSMYENNPDLDFFYPSEGTNLYVDAMCIPKCSQNKSAAEMYINFMCMKEAAVANAEYTYYASPNSAVKNDAEYIDYMNSIKDNGYETMYGTENVKATPYRNMTGEDLARINNLWEELKSDISVSPVIITLCAVIVVLIATLVTVSVVRKRMRRRFYA